ncbi:MAG: hypothetical protein ABR936_00655 [Bacteroidota bacterium]|jgi:hypothetical protein
MSNSIRWIKYIFFACIICSIGSQTGRAQDFNEASFESSYLLNQELPVVQSDSLPVSVVRRPRLQPENLGFFERNLWSENGLFRTMGIAAPLTPESRKSELKLRRTMLVAHETSGFLTLGLMATTVVYGQKVINQINDKHPSLSLRRTHIGFADATIATYSLTALLSLLSPPPVIRRDEMSTLSYHRALAWVHVTGIIITPIIAALAKRRGASYESILRIHQVSGYITTTAFAASMIVITF